MLGQYHDQFRWFTLPKTNMTMENPPFENVFPVENGDFLMSSLPETNIAPKNRCLEDKPFLLGWPIFRCKLAVCFQGG